MTTKNKTGKNEESDRERVERCRLSLLRMRKEQEEWTGSGLAPKTKNKKNGCTMMLHTTLSQKFGQMLSSESAINVIKTKATNTKFGTSYTHYTICDYHNYNLWNQVNQQRHTKLA